MCSRIFQDFCKTGLRLTLVTVFACTLSAEQTVSVGVKAGVPIMDAFAVASRPSSLNNYTFDTRRYTVGPAFELRLPYSFAFETDALYKRLNYASNPFGFDMFRATTSGHSWEFPLLLKHHFRGPLHPFGDLGVSLRRVSGKTNFTNGVFQTTQEPLELVHTWTTGLAAGGGSDLQIGPVHFQPEIRYTRWGKESFSSASGVLSSNLNALDLLIGVSLGK
jgi:opacity protein-like surface antigen